MMTEKESSLPNPVQYSQVPSYNPPVEIPYSVRLLQSTLSYYSLHFPTPTNSPTLKTLSMTLPLLLLTPETNYTCQNHQGVMRYNNKTLRKTIIS